jgi:hypothetical protein
MNGSDYWDCARRYIDHVASEYNSVAFAPERQDHSHAFPSMPDTKQYYPGHHARSMQATSIPVGHSELIHPLVRRSMHTCIVLADVR